MDQILQGSVDHREKFLFDFHQSICEKIKANWKNLYQFEIYFEGKITKGHVSLGIGSERMDRIKN